MIVLRPWIPHGILMPVLGLMVFLFLSPPVEGRSGRVQTSPVKISDVVISPNPFLIGKSPVTFSMLVQLPSVLNGANVLEVSALIASPTRRSMSFVSHRRLLSQDSRIQGVTSIPMTLVWDGKDQHQNMVPDGSYYYEIRAKLMEDEGFGPRTRIVSHRVQGTLDVLAYAGEVLPPAPPEPVLPDEVIEEQSDEVPDGTGSPDKGEELFPEDVQVVEEGLKVSDDPVNPATEGSKDTLGPDAQPQNYPEALPENPNEEKAGEIKDTVPSEKTAGDHPPTNLEGPVRILDYQPPSH